MGEHVALQQELVVGLQRLERLLEGARRGRDARQLLGDRVDVLCRAAAGVDLVLYAVQPRHQLRGEREVAVARRGSGVRNSSRFAFGDAEYIGIRIDAERFRLEYARFTGASKPGTSRL